MPSQTIDIWTGLPITKDQDDSSPHSFSALKDCLVSSMRSGSDTSVSNISPGEKIGFHDSNNHTTLTMEMSDVDESSTEEDNDDGRDQPATLERCSSHVRLSMCGAIHESMSDVNDSDSDWSSVASAKEEIAVEEDEILANEKEANQPVVVVHRRASNPLLPLGDDTGDRVVFPRRVSNPPMLGRRLSATGSRRDSVMSSSMQEAFQLVRDTFEHPQSTPVPQQQENEVSELGDDDDDEFAGYYDHYGYEDAVPDDKNDGDSVAPANRKASIGQQQRQQDTTDYGYGDTTPDSRAAAVDYGYGDAAPDCTTATEFQPSTAPPCVSWDVQQEDDAAKYGYGECHLATRRQSRAHYDYGYGSDHDMDSTWHHGEKMPSNRIPPHQDPAMIQDPQPKRRQRVQRDNSLRRSWNAQEQPRRRVQRRSSVTKFNLEDSLARVRREEEEGNQEMPVQEHTIPRTYSTLGATNQQPKQKTKLRFFRSKKAKTTNSRKHLQGLRDMFTFGPRRSMASTIRERDSEPFTMSSPTSAHQPEAVPERNGRFRLWFRRRQPKSQMVEI